MYTHIYIYVIFFRSLFLHIFLCAHFASQGSFPIFLWWLYVCYFLLLFILRYVSNSCRFSSITNKKFAIFFALVPFLLPPIILFSYVSLKCKCTNISIRLESSLCMAHIKSIMGTNVSMFMLNVSSALMLYHKQREHTHTHSPTQRNKMNIKKREKSYIVIFCSVLFEFKTRVEA